VDSSGCARDKSGTDNETEEEEEEEEKEKEEEEEEEKEEEEEPQPDLLGFYVKGKGAVCDVDNDDTVEEEDQDYIEWNGRDIEEGVAVLQKTVTCINATEKYQQLKKQRQENRRRLLQALTLQNEGRSSRSMVDLSVLEMNSSSEIEQEEDREKDDDSLASSTDSLDSNGLTEWTVDWLEVVLADTLTRESRPCPTIEELKVMIADFDLAVAFLPPPEGN
jgi:hypothetical protein